MTLEQLLAAIRAKGWASQGISLAGAYIQTALSGKSSLASFKSIETSQIKSALKECQNKLVYRDPDGVVTSLSLKSVSGSVKTQGQAERPNSDKLDSKSIMEFENILTTGKEDRDGDILMPEGARIDKNMPLLWQHLPMEPIGKLISVVSQTPELVKTHFGIANTKMGNDAALLVEYGALRISHGFKPLKFEPIKGRSTEEEFDGWKVFEYEVMEGSLVSIPANTGAVITAFSRNKLHSPIIKSWAEDLYRDRPVMVGAHSGRKTRKSSKPVVVNVNLGGKGFSVKSGKPQVGDKVTNRDGRTGVVREYGGTPGNIIVAWDDGGSDFFQQSLFSESGDGWSLNFGKSSKPTHACEGHGCNHKSHQKAPAAQAKGDPKASCQCLTCSCQYQASKSAPNCPDCGSAKRKAVSGKKSWICPVCGSGGNRDGETVCLSCGVDFKAGDSEDLEDVGDEDTDLELERRVDELEEGEEGEEKAAPVQLGELASKLEEMAGDESLPSEASSRLMVVSGIMGEVASGVEGAMNEVGEAGKTMNIGGVASAVTGMVGHCSAKLSSAIEELDRIASLSDMDPAKVQEVQALKDQMSSVLEGLGGKTGEEEDNADGSGISEEGEFENTDEDKSTKSDIGDYFLCMTCGRTFFLGIEDPEDCPSCGSEDIVEDPNKGYSKDTKGGGQWQCNECGNTWRGDADDSSYGADAGIEGTCPSCGSDHATFVDFRSDDPETPEEYEEGSESQEKDEENAEGTSLYDCAACGAEFHPAQGQEDESVCPECGSAEIAPSEVESKDGPAPASVTCPACGEKYGAYYARCPECNAPQPKAEGESETPEDGLEEGEEKGRKSGVTLTCPDCGPVTVDPNESIFDDGLFCPICGATPADGLKDGDSDLEFPEELAASGEEIKCGTCGKSASPGMMFCGYCGAPLPMTPEDGSPGNDPVADGGRDEAKEVSLDDPIQGENPEGEVEPDEENPGVSEKGGTVVEEWDGAGKNVVEDNGQYYLVERGTGERCSRIFSSLQELKKWARSIGIGS